MRILIVEDEDILRISLHDELEEAGHNIISTACVKTALRLLHIRPFEVVMTDLKMPQMDGLFFIERALAIQPEVTPIVMTAYGTVESAVEAIRLGVLDYLLKPFSTDELILLLKRVQKHRNLLAENTRLRKQLNALYAHGIPYQSNSFRNDARRHEDNWPNVLAQCVAQYESALIRQALEKSCGNKAKAAQLLNISISTLRYKIKKYDLE